MNVLVFIVFGIFVVCGIAGTVYFNKMVNILQEENVPTTFADRCFFPFNLRNKFIHFVHTCPDREKQAEYMKVYKRDKLCIGISLGVFALFILLMLLPK